MRYYSFLIFLVAASVCFTPHRRNDESPSSHEKQLGRTDDVHINQVHGNRDRLIEDIRVCGQFLNGLNALSTEFKSNSSLLNFVEACERVVVVLDRAVDRSLHRVQSPEQRNLPGLVRRDWLYSAEDEIPGTTASAFFKEDSPSDASTLECTFLKTERQNAERKYRRWEEICEEKVCAIENLDKICQAETIDPSAAQTCKMCYPEENAQLINSHCQAKWGVERKAFYVVSFVLIGVTLISGLILYIRRRYLRAKNSHADEFTTNGSGINPPGELYYYDGPRSIMPSEIQSSLSSLAVNCSPEPSEYEDTKTHPSSWDDNEDGVISTSVAQRRLKQLGILSKTRRKRVHDLFDLEALQSKRGTTKSSQQHSNEMDRVPVMPWAPNASNRYSTRFSSHVRPTARSESPPGVESREMPRIPRTVP